MWNCRVFSVAEACHVARIRRPILDVIISRNKEISPLFSERRGSRRWFSRQDICVLRVAIELERAGRNWLTAIAQAFEHLAQPPPPGALLIVPVDSVSASSGVVVDRLPDPIPSKSFITIPIGRIVAEVQDSADVLDV